MKLLFFAYWLLTTILGVYWLIKNPSHRHGDDSEYFTLAEALAHVFPSALLSWAILPLILLSKIRFKR